MIIEEIIDNRAYHYSSKNMMILQHPTNILYEDALDIIPCPYTYTESEIPIETEVTVEDKAEAYDILMGD